MNAQPAPAALDLSHHSETVQNALARGGLIDLTTHGRLTGEERRIEIVFFNFDGRLYISGMPGRRAWYANIIADSRVTIHLKRGVTADLPAKARPITDPSERTALLTSITRVWKREGELDRFVAASPLIEVTLD